MAESMKEGIKMKYVGFVQYGTMFSYRMSIKKLGMKIKIEKGKDIMPYLKEKNMAIYIDSGMLYFRLYRPNGTYVQLMAFNSGVILPLFEPRKDFLYSDIEMLVAAREEVTGFVFPMRYYMYMKKTDLEFAKLLNEQWMNITSYLCVAQILYRDGECLTRVSNLLFHVYFYKDYDSKVFPINQEELAYTVNASKSQVKRALTCLRDEGGIELQYEQIIIKDISIIEKHISDSMRAEELSIAES